MADIPATLTGLGALLVAVLGTVGPAAAAGAVVTAPSPLVAPVGSPTALRGASVAGFGAAPLRLVITVTSGVLELPATAADVTTPAGYPALGDAGPQLAIEGDESAVNGALADLSWVPAVPGPAEITLDAAPAGAAYEHEGAHFYQLVASPTPITWSAARDAAASMTFEGLPGSLAAITTEAEHALLAQIAPVDAWVGTAELGSPTGVRWIDAPDHTSTISNFIVEYDELLAEGAPIVGRALGGVRAAVAPSAPLVTDVAAGIGEATVHWQQPLADSGAPVLGYVVSGNPDGWCAVPATQTSCVLRGLVGEAAHTFRVAAINEVGLGAWSEPSPPITPTGDVAPTKPAVDAVDTTVQPVPNEAPATDAAVEPVAPVVDDTAPAVIAGDAASPTPAASPAATPPAPVTPDAAATTTSSPAAIAAAVVEPPAADASTPTEGFVADGAPATDAAASDAAAARAGSPALTVVFDVGPGATLADARFTVRGKHLSPGTVVTVVAHSAPVVIGTIEVGTDGTLTWVGELPADLADGDHRLIAQGVGHDGSKVERTMPFAAESGRLVRIGASSLETIAPTVSTPAAPVADALVADAAAVAPSPSSSDSSGSGGLPRRALAALALLGGAAVLLWRTRSRRTAGRDTVTTDQPAAGDTSGLPRPARAVARADLGGSSRRHQLSAPGARRRSRRQPARSL